MKLDRKTFLRSLGAGAFGLFATRGWAAFDGDPEQLTAAPVWDAADPEGFWRQVRAQFPMTPERTYFNTGGLGPAPRRVLDMLTVASRQLQERVETGHDFFAQARVIVAAYFGARPDELCFVRNATEGNCIVATGLELQAADEVIFESHAHPGGSFPWLNRQRTDGIVVKTFEPDPVRAEGNVERIAALITPRTRVIQVSHITAPTGIIMPVPAIARLARQHNLWFHVDGAQSAGMIPVNLPALGCDSFATSGHKWIGGPHETGVFWIRGDKVGKVTPRQVGAHSGDDINLKNRDAFKYSTGANRYEYGTRNAASVLALAEAVRFQNEIGRDRIAARGHALADHVRAGFAKIDGVEILTPADPGMCGSILTIHSPKMTHGKIFEHLLADHHLRCRPVDEVGLDAVRVSTHLFNSIEECDH
ncbi:MAG: aminotransferase class V-fold PLP-dependent enzyme, partial [Opitutales bacterium]